VEGEFAVSALSASGSWVFAGICRAPLFPAATTVEAEFRQRTTSALMSARAWVVILHNIGEDESVVIRYLDRDRAVVAEIAVPPNEMAEESAPTTY